ncbi:unnamed protein product [Nezara viridula]|uniref:Uncharacterized protein n=1 Tax=Nezara viridula TaxID=85310 RepID=A0A9P0MVI7_NEZVI|nr:unnamed protein product [Nezara viridula]
MTSHGSRTGNFNGASALYGTCNRFFGTLLRYRLDTCTHQRSLDNAISENLPEEQAGAVFPRAACGEARYLHAIFFFPFTHREIFHFKQSRVLLTAERRKRFRNRRRMKEVKTEEESELGDAPVHKKRQDLII